jgi:adenylylsulfate kinase
VIKTLPGLQIPYEEPRNPDIKVETHRETVEESVDKVLKYIEEKYLG